MALTGEDKQDLLTKETAQLRSQVVSDVQYDIYINLCKGKETYCAKVTIHFNYTPREHLNQLQIDFVTTRLKRCILNGEEYNDYTLEKYALYLDSSCIRQGENVIELDYTNTFDRTGAGFHKFFDPEDNVEYMHTDFEPFDAHRLFPSFDQPDIKAVYQLRVEGPEEWTYLHNTRPEREELYLGRKKIKFKQTKKFSTYLFALIVGPYQSWSDTYRNIPLGLYCRKSLAKYMEADNIFAITKESFALMEEYFDYPYPFEKYDQVFVPEFNFGAMENVGCITFSERYLFRNKKLYGEYLNRANTISHEMVHMWFGDLVTMKWWDDLWLNESFADYLSYYILSKGTLYPDSLEHFFVRKEWAYNQDQLSTTHPVAASAEDTIAAFSNFDGISYSKGASVLRQLQYFVSDEVFREAMRAYFKKYEWSNTTLRDFLQLMSEKSGIDIVSWSEKWLQQTGVNTLEAEIGNGQCIIRQHASKDNNLLRDHAIEYTGYAVKGESLAVTESGKVTVSDREYALPLKSNETTLVVLNTNEYDYVKIYFNDGDVEVLEHYLPTLDNTFVRRTVWGGLWHMVRDNKLSPLRFLETARSLAARETDPSVLQGHIVSKMISILTWYLGRENRERLVPEYFTFARNMLADGENSDQQQIIWFRLLTAAAENGEALDYLEALLEGKESISNLEIDQEKRWSIITRLNAFGRTGAPELIERELAGDTGDLGQKKAFMARTAVPSLEAKDRAWDLFTGDNTHSTDYIRFGMQGFVWDCQRELLKPFVDRYFENLVPVFQTRDVHYSRAFCSLLFPHWDHSDHMLKRVETFLREEDKDMPQFLRKELSEIADLLKRLLPIIKGQ